MTTYNLNLTKNYCNHWGIWEAIREILQNGSDQARKNPNNVLSIHYDEKKQKLIISNKESILERDTILLGGTNKDEDDEMTGNYGEGYKIALLIFEKLNKRTVIKNYARKERWTTTFNKEKKYNDKPVLKIKIHKHIIKTVPDNNLSFEIEGITKEEWAIVNEKYLPLRGEYEKFTSLKGDEILLDKELKGKVFINGLFVEDLGDKFEYGYNLTAKTMKLDRDRQSVKGYDFNSITANLMCEYANKGGAEKIADAIENKSSEVVTMSFGFNHSKGLSEELKKRFIEKNGEDSFPVTTQKEMEYVNRLSRNVTPIIVSENEKNFLSRNDIYSDADAFIEERSTEEENEKTPKEILERFLLKHGRNLHYDAKEDLEKIIAQSENWNDLTPTLEKINEESVVENELDSETEENTEVYSEIKQEEPVPSEFDDDIPF
jgi:hypothetical protein